MLKKTNLFAAMFVSLLGATACSQPESADVTSEISNTDRFGRHFDKIISCNDDALIVDVDLNNPQTGQIVIKDRVVIDYFLSQGVIVDARPTQTGMRDGQIVEIPNKHELIFYGRHNGGRMSSASEFQSLRGGQIGQPSERYALVGGFGPFHRHAYVANIYREFGGIKVRIDEHLRAYQGCSHGNPNQACGDNGGHFISLPEENLEDRANWFFSRCN